MSALNDKIKKIPVTYRKTIIWIVLLATVLFVSYPAFDAVIHAGHDLLGLSGRIEGIKSAWECGQIFPVIMPNANNGYGYLEFMYPELFLLIPAFLRYIGLSMVTALHIYIFIINAATAVFSYFGVKTVLDDISKKDKGGTEYDETAVELISLLSACYFLMNQYRLLDLYIRAAIGEAVSMGFIVFAIAGLYHILTGNRRLWWMAVIGMSGILHSHILSCALIVPVVLILGVVFFGNIIREGRWKETLYAVVVFFMVNAWYIVPFIRFYKFGLNTDALIVDDVWNHTVRLMQLFSTSAETMGQDYVLISLGIASLLILILTVTGSVINLGSNKDAGNHTRIFLPVISGIFMLYLIFSLDIMPFLWVKTSIEKIWGIVSMLQFPYRLLTVASVCLVFMLAITLINTEYFRNNLLTIGTVLMVFAIMGSGNLMREYEGYTIGMEKSDTGFEKNVPDDYLPAGIDKSIFDDTNVYIEGEDVDFSWEKNGTDVVISYKISQPAVCSVPLLYYPCYTASTEDGSNIEVFQMEDKRIGLSLPAGEHTVHLKVKLFNKLW